MRFIEGVTIGALVTASAMILWSEPIDDSKKRMIKKGKQFAKKMGIN